MLCIKSVSTITLSYLRVPRVQEVEHHDVDLEANALQWGLLELRGHYAKLTALGDFGWPADERLGKTHAMKVYCNTF